MANTGKDLTAANIRYLLALRDLDGDQRGVRCVSIAEALGVSKPSVHAMMDTLKKLSLVDKDRYGTVRFTPAGRELADQYESYFQTIYNHFSALLPCTADARSAAYALIAELPADCLQQMCSRMIPAILAE